MLKTDLQTFDAPQNKTVSEYVVQRYDEKCEWWDHVHTADTLHDAHEFAREQNRNDGGRYRVLHVTVIFAIKVE